MKLRAIVAADMKRHGGSAGAGAFLRMALFKRTFRPVLTLRLCQAAARGPARLLLPLSRLWHRWACGAAGIDLPWDTRIGPGFRIVHGFGLVVNREAEIGRDVTVFHGVTIGQRDSLGGGERQTAQSRIGDNAMLGAYAMILGVEIGEGSIVSPLSVVTAGVPPHSHAAGNPAKVIRESVDFAVKHRTTA